MNKELISKMATDMQLFRFENESNEKFATRVLFSGMSIWMRVIALDGSSSNDLDRHSVSKKHHTERSTRMLNEFLKFVPTAMEWFYDDASLNDPLFPIHDLQKRLLTIGELMELVPSGRIAPVKPCAEKVYEKIIRQKGFHNKVLSQYNGIVSIVNNAEASNLYPISTVDTLDFFEKCILSCNFTTDTWSAEKEYYDPFEKTNTFYKSWKRNKVEQKYCFSRIETGLKQYRYFIEVNKNGILKSSKLDDFIIESGNLHRLLLALRFKVSNPITVTIAHYSDHFELKRHIKNLPYPEEAIFRSFGWPISSISDNQNFCYHYKMLPVIKKELENLLIKIKEVTDERPI